MKLNIFNNDAIFPRKNNLFFDIKNLLTFNKICYLTNLFKNVLKVVKFQI